MFALKTDPLGQRVSTGDRTETVEYKTKLFKNKNIFLHKEHVFKSKTTANHLCLDREPDAISRLPGGSVEII